MHIAKTRLSRDRREYIRKARHSITHIVKHTSPLMELAVALHLIARYNHLRSNYSHARMERLPVDSMRIPPVLDLSLIWTLARNILSSICTRRNLTRRVARVFRQAEVRGASNTTETNLRYCVSGEGASTFLPSEHTD